jgi:hypothetical protein
MPVSEARLNANRRNALKHGLAGDGVVLPTGAAAEVEGLDRELQAELRPSNALGRILVRRIAVLAVRMDQCVHQQAAATAERKRNAGAAFDDARMAEAERLISWIATEPATYARRLQQTPEGLDLMIRQWEGLGTDLFHPRKRAWDYSHLQRALNLKGRRNGDFPESRLEALCKVLWDDPSNLEPGEADGKNPDDLKAWATLEIEKIILAELARLTALREAIDEQAVAIDRAEAPERAVFDTSKDSILARKYEAAAERGFYRALRELREVEVEARSTMDQPEASELSPMGSFRSEDDRDDPEAPRPPISADRRPPATPSRPVSGPNPFIGGSEDGPRSLDRGFA